MRANVFLGIIMKRLLVAATLFLAATSAFAGPARDRLESFSDGLRSLQGRFVQQVHDANGQLKESSRGTVALKAPRAFRWHYEEPFPQLIVADGNNVWIHDEDLDQVTVKNQSFEEAQSPLTVLTDLGQLDARYTVREGGARDGLEWLELVPRAKEPSFTTARLGFSGEGLARMELVDTLGQRNTIRFSGWKRNAALDPKLFTFTPPAGADVIGEPVDNAESFPVKD